MPSHTLPRTKSSKFLPTDLLQRAYQLLPLVREAEGPRYHRGLAEGKTFEQLLQALWAAQHFDPQKPLQTTDRRGLTVKYPGQWNRESGPDFLRAKCLFADGTVVTGDIEVHVLASDWYRHHHHQDPRYSNVILHVVYRNDLETPHLLQPDGNLIPQLELASYLLDDPSLWDDPAVPHPTLTPRRSPCYEALGQILPEKMTLFLELMGDMRFAEKGERFRQRIEERGVEQALYEGLMEALGYKTNRFSFWKLARSLPLAKLSHLRAACSPANPPRFFQGLFFGVGNLLAPPSFPLDGETEAYVEEVGRFWEIGKAYGLEAQSLPWNFIGIRPANSPFRRIAALSHLLSRISPEEIVVLLYREVQRAWEELQRGGGPSKALRPLHTLLQPDEDLYWSYRYTLGGKKLARPHKLLGEERARTMVLDILFPCLFAWARIEQDLPFADQVYRLYTLYPRLGTNTLLRYMQEQLFAGSGTQQHLIDTARKQQALLYLYHHFCWEEASTCTECSLLTIIRELY